MAYTVEIGKLKGSYKVIGEFEEHERSKAWGFYFRVKIEEGQRKRIREGNKILKRNSCYWT